jgi:DNA-binding response OmpR family regulator
MEWKGKILIVEDEEGVASFLRDFFMENGYDSSIAEDGIEAEELWEKESYQLIITDVIFGRTGGLNFIKTIRAKDRSIPIVVITGFGPETANEALELGANDFLLKPFGISQLRSKISKFLSLNKE